MSNINEELAQNKRVYCEDCRWVGDYLAMDTHSVCCYHIESMHVPESEQFVVRPEPHYKLCVDMNRKGFCRWFEPKE